MTKISSRTLFNFTDNLDHLLNNLREGFYCHNTYEKLPIRDNGYRVPMACFCDIPLSLIEEHFDWYGRYGIGIERDYARDLGVQPVWCITKQSNIVKNLIKHNLSEYERKYVLPYLKQYYGKQIKDGKEKEKRFYDEREWRYIPADSSVEIFLNTPKNKIPKSEQKAQRMKLDLSKVKYIIIEKESDLEQTIKEIKKISRSEKAITRSLITKIITSKQVIEDF